MHDNSTINHITQNTLRHLHRRKNEKHYKSAAVCFITTNYTSGYGQLGRNMQLYTIKKKTRQSLYLDREWNNKKYCIPTSIVNLNIVESVVFFFLSFPFNQSQPQQRVAGYSQNTIKKKTRLDINRRCTLLELHLQFFGVPSTFGAAINQFKLLLFLGCWSTGFREVLLCICCGPRLFLVGLPLRLMYNYSGKFSSSLR